MSYVHLSQGRFDSLDANELSSYLAHGDDAFFLQQRPGKDGATSSDPIPFNIPVELWDSLPVLETA